MNKFSEIWKKYGTFAILILLVALLGVLSPEYFFKTDNLIQVLVQSAITILLACGEFFAILIAGIDLSVGSIAALTGMITAKLMIGGAPVWLAILLGGYVLYRQIE